MKIKKGQLLQIHHDRKGSFKAIATEDFDTKDEWYRIAVAQEKDVIGMNTCWENGDKISCRKGLCEIKKI